MRGNRTPLSRAARLGGLKQAVRTTAAALATLALTRWLDLAQGYWAVVTTVIVMQAHLGGSIRACAARLGGTAVGAVAGVLAVEVLGQTWPALGLSVFTTIAVCSLAPRLRDSARVAGITAAIIILVGRPGEPALLLGLHRFTEIALGIVMALFASAVVFPSRARAAMDRGLAALFDDLAGLFAAVVVCRLREHPDKTVLFPFEERILRTLARCRVLQAEADAEGRGSAEAARHDMLLGRGEMLFEQILGMAQVVEETKQARLHRAIPGEMTALAEATAQVLSGIAAVLRRKIPLTDITDLEKVVAATRARLAALRREGTDAAFDLAEVLHFFSFVHGMLACAANAAEVAARLDLGLPG